MLRIKLFCAGGMSTSILVTKMKKAAESRGLDVEIGAYPESTIDTQTNECDVALLGPQVRYMLAQAKEICKPKEIPVDVISMQDYGMMNGEKVLDFALSLL